MLNTDCSWESQAQTKRSHVQFSSGWFLLWTLVSLKFISAFWNWQACAGFLHHAWLHKIRSPLITVVGDNNPGSYSFWTIYLLEVYILFFPSLTCTTSFLGITKFNLLGRFGSFRWLGSFWLVLFYNSLFSALTVIILLQRVTRPLLQEAASLLGAMLWSKRDKHSKSPLKMVHND